MYLSVFLLFLLETFVSLISFVSRCQRCAEGWAGKRSLDLKKKKRLIVTSDDFAC